MAQLDFDATAFPPPAEQPQQDPMTYFNQIDDNDPDPSMVLHYLHALHTQAMARGVQCESPDHFYSEQGMEMWRVAWSERPTDVQFPAHVDLLQIKSILFNALTPFHCNTTGMDCHSMVDRVRRAQQIQSVWLAEQNHQDETPAQKRARQNREAQQRLRLREKNDGSPEVLHAKALKQAYDDYMLACRQRKEAEAQWAQYVADKKAAWESIKAQKPLN